MRCKVAISVCMLLLCYRVAAQQVDDYRYYKLFEQVESDEKLVLEEPDTIAIPAVKALWYRSLFDKSSVVVSYRYGVGYYDRRLFFEGISLSNIGDSRLSRLAMSRSTSAEIDRDNLELSTQFYDNTSIGLNLTTRSYLGGVSLSTAHHLTDKWALCSDIYIHSGRDSHIKGVFTSEASVALTAQYSPDSLSRLSLIMLCTPTERSSRRASVAEAFTLVGDNYYNPAWGYQAGKERSANINSSILPTLVSSYSRRLTEKSELTLSLGATAGQSKQSSLDWLNATTPMPDNYRKLPSYFDHPTDIANATNAWINNDSSITQIDFDGIYQSNYLSSDAIYLIGDRVTRTTDLQFCGAMKSQIGNGINLSYGIRATYCYNRNFKQVADLLGGNGFVDIDYFLVDDNTLSNYLDNDMQHPARRVGVSDRYSYDYALTEITTSLFATLEYKRNRLYLQALAEVGAQWVSRIGYFQKGIFEESSLGRSRVLNYSPWCFGAQAEYYLTTQQTLYGSLSASAKAAESQHQFLQTQYNNRPVDNPTLAKSYSLTAGYRLKRHKLALQAHLFANFNDDMTDVAHIYYDAASEFSDVVTENISTLAIGLEVEAHYDLHRNWQAALATSFGRYCYANAPTLKVYSDQTNTLLSTQVVTTAKGLHTGTTPQISTVGQINYHNRGWRVSLEAEYHALRYIVPSLVRRTEDVLSHAATDEIREQFISQERLGDAFAMNATLSKSFYLNRFNRREYSTSAAPRFIDRHPRSRITLLLAVNNILGNEKIVYRGYESSRIRKRYLWNDFNSIPLPSYLLYAYPRTYYLQVKFTF